MDSTVRLRRHREFSGGSPRTPRAGRRLREGTSRAVVQESIQGMLRSPDVPSPGIGASGGDRRDGVLAEPDREENRGHAQAAAVANGTASDVYSGQMKHQGRQRFGRRKGRC